MADATKQEPTLSPLGRWATRYAERLDLAIYPIRPRSKKALLAKWTLDATADLATVTEWWRVNPRANIGMLLGKSDLVAIDVDAEVMELWRELVAEMKEGHGVDLEATWVAETPGDGLHIFYRANGVAYATALMRGIEVKAGNHGMVLAPSIHPDTGTCYGWAIDQAPGEIALASVPACLDPLLPRSGQSKSRTHHAAGEVALSWPEILEPYGWTAVNPNGNSVTRWRRAGKRDGHSATTNYEDRNTLYVFSANAEPFEAEHSYNRLAAYAILNHGGDVEAAREALQIEAPSDGATANTLVSASPNDIGNADRLIARYGAILRYVELWRHWVIWDGQRWAQDLGAGIRWHAMETQRAMERAAKDEPDADKRAKLEKWAKAQGQAARIRAMVECAEPLAGVRVTPDDLDTHPMLLNCLNGTLDLATGELREHRREDFITKLCPVEYHRDAKAPVWDYVVRTASGNDETLLAFKRRAYGYALTGATREQCFFLLYGTGSNGKSTELTAIRGTLGADYAMHAETGTFLAQRTDGVRNDLARLRGTRFLTAIEADAGRRLAEALIKQATGGDPITARFLFQEQFEYMPAFKLFLAVNHRPIIRGQDHALWRRVRLVPYTVTIPDADQDRDLPEKLATKEEREGILAWLVAGCADWLANGLGTPEAVTTATAAYRDDMDTLGQFIGDACMVGAQYEVTSKVLHAAYVTWCEANSERPLSKRAMGERLKERGFEQTRGTGGIRGWTGIGVRHE